MEVDDVSQALFAYTTVEVPKPEELEGTESWSAEQWQAEFDRTRLRLESFFAARDPSLRTQQALRLQSTQIVMEPRCRRSS
jgi:hypothetical protein